MGIFNFFKKEKDYSEIVNRTAYAYKKFNEVGGKKILEAAFLYLNQINEDLDINDARWELLTQEVRKLGLFWLTRDIWKYIVQDEDSAKFANLILFKWFEKGNVKHKDIEEYARASGSPEEVQIFGKNVARIFNCYGAAEILTLNQISALCYNEVLKNTNAAFTLPISEIKKYTE